jgi:hypothetical protein
VACRFGGVQPQPLLKLHLAEVSASSYHPWISLCGIDPRECLACVASQEIRF